MIYIVIPTLNPDDKFIKLVEDLNKNKFKNVIVVDDGSDKKTKHYFKEAKKKYGVILLTHKQNKGKGRAMKTAFEYYIKNVKKGKGLITIDADGQHTVKDIKRMMKAMKKDPDDLILGVRDFNDDIVPLRSRLGNKITLFFMNVVCKVEVSDTQTGLRGIPNKYVDNFLEIEGERYEYETNMLLYTSKYGIKIKEVKIETVYIDDNASSHFDTVKDSARIYKEIFKYIFK